MPRTRTPVTFSKCMQVSRRWGGHGLPVVPADLDGETPFRGQIGDVAHPQERVLKMSGDDGKVLGIESDESQEVHGATNLLLNFKV